MYVSIVYSFTPHVQHVSVNGAAVISCVPFKGSISWTQDGQELVHSNKLLIFDHFLVITDVKINSGGLYSCYGVTPDDRIFLRASRIVVDCELK